MTKMTRGRNFEKDDLYFTLESRSCLDWFRTTLIGLKLAQAQYVMSVRVQWSSSPKEGTKKFGSPKYVELGHFKLLFSR